MLTPAHGDRVRRRTSGALFLHLWNEIFRRAGVNKELLPPTGSFLREVADRHPIDTWSGGDCQTRSGQYAIVTPYYQETRDVLEHCIRSVREQTVATDHFLVADGFALDWIDDAGVRHIRLDRSHEDFGGTPRGIGAMIAASEGYQAIGFLDADCWLEADHVEYCLALAEQAGPNGCDYVVALRHERRPDGTIMNVRQVPPEKHVDTNCFFFLPTGFHVLPVWSSIPRQVSIVGDRLFYKAVKANSFRPVVATRKTVNYTCMWELIYWAMGENPPQGAKPNPDHHQVERWISELSADALAVINRSIQTRLEDLYPLYKAEEPSSVSSACSSDSGATTSPQSSGSVMQRTTMAPLTQRSAWVPQRRSAGTELMVAGLKERMGPELDRINLKVNHPGDDKADDRPRVVWMHHDVNQRWVQWCKDKALVDSVTWFVFVSYWQRQRYIDTFGLPPQRCVVLRHALDIDPEMRRWETAPILRCAYTSTPFRGLSVLLDAWGRVSPTNAELHIWSSMKFYLDEDRPYEHLYARAQSMRGVIFHGLAPNPELRAALRSMHFLVYPCTFAEAACLAAIEAMAAGCRLIIPSLGALPETSGGYARVYPSNPNAEDHVTTFSENLMAELEKPWAGTPNQSLDQQAHCAAVYDWPRRLREWRQLIQSTCSQSNRHRAGLRV